MKRFSILQNKKECYVCGTTQNINTHEVYFGKNRNNSIKYGCCVYLWNMKKILAKGQNN